MLPMVEEKCENKVPPAVKEWVCYSFFALFYLRHRRTPLVVRELATVGFPGDYKLGPGQELYFKVCERGRKKRVGGGRRCWCC